MHLGINDPTGWSAGKLDRKEAADRVVCRAHPKLNEFDSRKQFCKVRRNPMSSEIDRPNKVDVGAESRMSQSSQSQATPDSRVFGRVGIE